MKVKVIKKIVYILLLLILSSVVYFLFKIEMSNEVVEKEKVGYVAENTMLPTPDRIVYKSSGKGYMVIDSEQVVYSEIYSELYNRVTDVVDGKVCSEDEIREMQDRGEFIELDYDVKSKNFIFMLEENEIGIIRRTENGGQVIQTSLLDKDKLILKMSDLTKDVLVRRDFGMEYNYVSDNKLSDVTSDMGLSTTKVTGVYQKVIKYDKDKYKEILDKLNFSTNQYMHEVDFNSESVVITASKYRIKSIRKSIGNIRYELGEFLGEYMVNVFVVSNIVNTNCIYFDVNDNEMNVSNFSEGNIEENKVGYYVQDGGCYANLNNIKMNIITMEEAADIAEKEATKSVYQYQSWKSDFYAVDNENESISGELILGLDEISKLYHWREEWKVKEYEGKLMWKIRLFDRNDPLTSLYVYVDAVSGDVVGAGDSSD